METKIKRRRFGKTGLYVSELGFGAMNLRRLDTIDEAYKILNYVLDQGINFIDTARAYNGENGQGQLVESEVLVGNAIRNRADLDEPIVIVTKGHGYTLEELDKELATSLGKLGIEGKGNLKIGNNDVKLVYFLHGINEDRWNIIKSSGVLEKLQSLKAEGVINYIGFSSHYGDTNEIKAALDTGVFDVVELPYNIFNRSLGEDGSTDFLEYAYKKDVGIVNMKAFGGNGMPAIYNMIRDLVTIDYAAMLNYCLTNPHISTVDAGAMYIEQFKLDMETAMGERLTAAQVSALKQESDKISKDMQGICRECMHCQEKFTCSQDVNFPEILALYARHTIGEKLEKDTAQYASAYTEMAINADNCIECGECLPWCEYKLDIPAMLKRAHEVFTEGA